MKEWRTKREMNENQANETTLKIELYQRKYNQTEKKGEKKKN